MQSREYTYLSRSNSGSEFLSIEPTYLTQRKTKKNILLQFKEKQKELEVKEKQINEEASSKVKKEIMADIKALDASQSSKAIQANLTKRTKVVFEEIEMIDQKINGPRSPSKKFPHFLIEKAINQVGEKGAFDIFFCTSSLETFIGQQIKEGDLIM